MSWQPIDTAPKDGTLIVCWKEGWHDPTFLRWKTNRRLPEIVGYFGDPVEMDDYDLAEPGGGPTHWHPLASLPVA